MKSASLRHFFDRSPELLATLSSDGKLRCVNAAWRAALGWSEADLAGRPIESLLRHADGLDLSSPSALDVEIAHRDGSFRTASLALCRVGGELCCQARLNGPGDGYPAQQVLAGSIPHLVWLVSRDGVPQYLDQHWLDFTGWQLERPERRTWLAALHPEDREEAGELWAHATAGGAPFQTQCRLRARSGEYRWFLASALPLRAPQGDVHHWLGTCTDIHDLRLAQEARDAQAKGLAAILESITDGFFAVDRGWHFTYLNHHAERLLQVRRAEVLGQAIWTVFRAAGCFETNFRRAMDLREPAEFEEFYTPLNKWIEVRAFPAPDGLAVYFRDTTEKRRLEQQLRESTQLETIGILAGGIAHDFNNLLTGILGNASLAKSLLGSGEPVDHLLDAVIRSGERAATLTRQMLEFSGRGQLVIGKMDLTAMAGKMRPLIETAAAPAATRLQLEAGLPLVEADEAQLRQVLINLVINAAEAIGDSEGGLIEIRTLALDIDAAWLREHVLHGSLHPGRHVCLQVSDNGCGIDRAILGRIFDPFFTTKFTGRGLGLAAAAGIIRSHHGALLVESEAGRGSTFRIFFAAAS